MLPALDTAAAFYGQHMPDGLPREQRNAIRDALAALIAAERAAVREACAARAAGWKGRRLESPNPETPENQAFGRGVDMAAHYIADDLSALPLE